MSENTLPPEDCGCGQKQMSSEDKGVISNLIEKVFVSSDEQKRRMALCKECEHFNDMLTQCRVCGCFLEAKTRLKSFHCALDQIGEEPKW